MRYSSSSLSVSYSEEDSASRPAPYAALDLGGLVEIRAHGSKTKNAKAWKAYGVGGQGVNGKSGFG